jgi:phage-related protein
LAEKVNAFEAMLNSMKGYQRLEDSFEPDVFRLAYYSGGNDFTNSMTQYGEATITFTCRPERFLTSGEHIVAVTNGEKLINPTRFTSKPLLHIEGTGTITVAIGGNTISASVTDYINIDCETMNAYRTPTENKNSSIGGTFPTIEPGENSIGTTGTITKATIVPRFFTI